MRISAKNLIRGRITGIIESVVLGEVVLDIGQEKLLPQPLPIAV
ncbi:MAG: hypothetical protein QNK27_02165 [Desulfuromusa sp.]|nr:hypothetical protein [Desulfuromusa sp.]